MNHVQIRLCNDLVWYNFPFMVTEAEIDNVIVTWPTAWKVGLGSPQPITTSTYGKETTPGDKDKEAEQCIEKDAKMGAENDVEQDTEHEEEKYMEQDPRGEFYLDLGGLDGLDGTSVKYSSGTKHGTEAFKRAQKKRKGYKVRGTEEVTLTEYDLEKIMDSVTYISED